MLRSLVSTARRQRFVALLGVIALSLTVPPAFGATSVTTQIAKALKLAKTANTNATKALTLAKTASVGTSGPAGAAGAAGAKGATGAAGPAGATGPAGPAGAKGDAGATGAKGDKGDTGATGATGAQGIQGPAAPAGAGTNAFYAFTNSTTGITTAPSVLALKTLPAGSYVLSGRVQVTSNASSQGVDCQLQSSAAAPTDPPIDDTSVYPIHGNYSSVMPLNGAITLTASADILLSCTNTQGSDSALTAQSAKLTAVQVGSIG